MGVILDGLIDAADYAGQGFAYAAVALLLGQEAFGCWCLIRNVWDWWAGGEVTMLVLLYVTGLAVLLGRLTVPGHGLSWPGAYEALAHIWVGFAACYAYLAWQDDGLSALILLAILTVFETAMFFAQNKTILLKKDG